MWGPARSQQQQHDQAVPMDTAATARPAVVRSALMNQPPQRRAHMLLQEMAGLANRLVELAGKVSPRLAIVLLFCNLNFYLFS